MIKQYLYNVFLTLDQSFNVIFLGGDPDVSVSSHLALAQFVDKNKSGKKKWFVDGFAKFIDFLFDNSLYTIEKNHVENSLEPYENNHKAVWKWYTLYEGENES